MLEKKKSSKCKVCNCGFVDLIDDKLFNKVRVKDILTWAHLKGADFSESSLERHRKKHFTPKIVSLPQNKDNQLNDVQLETLTDFLDLIIDKVNGKVKEGKIVPTVTEAVKAAEIKVKMKEESKMEKELIKFFMDVSRNHGAIS